MELRLRYISGIDEQMTCYMHFGLCLGTERTRLRCPEQDDKIPRELGAHSAGGGENCPRCTTLPGHDDTRDTKYRYKTVWCDTIPTNRGVFVRTSAQGVSPELYCPVN